MFYAEINQDNICFALLETDNEINKPTMIQIESMNTNVLGRKFENGEWIDVEPEPVTTEPNEQEIIQAELLLSQQEILTRLNNKRRFWQ